MFCEQGEIEIYHSWEWKGQCMIAFTNNSNTIYHACWPACCTTAWLEMRTKFQWHVFVRAVPSSAGIGTFVKKVKLTSGKNYRRCPEVGSPSPARSLEMMKPEDRAEIAAMARKHTQKQDMQVSALIVQWNSHSNVGSHTQFQWGHISHDALRAWAGIRAVAWGGVAGGQECSLLCWPRPIMEEWGGGRWSRLIRIQDSLLPTQTLDQPSGG